MRLTENKKRDDHFFLFPFVAGMSLRISSKLMVGFIRANGLAGGSTGITPAGNGNASNVLYIEARWP